MIYYWNGLRFVGEKQPPDFEPIVALSVQNHLGHIS